MDVDREIDRGLRTAIAAKRLITFSYQGRARNKGQELAWEAFVNGEAALARALNASLRV